jgi:hypothetical protein
MNFLIDIFNYKIMINPGEEHCQRYHDIFCGEVLHTRSEWQQYRGEEVLHRGCLNDCHAHHRGEYQYPELAQR